MKTPKTPIEFDCDLWTTEDGKCMVRVKITGEVTEVDRIKTSDQLHLPTPTPIYHNEVAQPTEIQKEMVQELSERAAKVHAGIVDASVDNSGQPLKCYDGGVFAQSDKLTAQNMANSLGVSYSAFITRLRELNLLDWHPIEEYISCDLCFGGAYDPKDSI